MNTQVKEKIESLLLSTQRQGITKLVDYLRDSDFFVAPASSRFHGCYEGGLAEHSLAVYVIMVDFLEKINLAEISAPGQQSLSCDSNSISIACLLHDVCKIGAYLPNDKGGYKTNREHPKGHATLSIERIKQYIELTPAEEMMIRYHMGVYGCNEFYKPDDSQSGEYPLRGDNTKSKEERYGNSLANAWYHNPICKLLYFCDELATLRDKATK
ncbi:MAG: HD domain-containing protein [Candidatus Micrarchaeia archaeon]|jgi:hypothetical protein